MERPAVVDALKNESGSVGEIVRYALHLETRVKELEGGEWYDAARGEAWKAEAKRFEADRDRLRRELAKSTGGFCEACTCESCMEIQESRDAAEDALK